MPNSMRFVLPISNIGRLFMIYFVYIVLLYVVSIQLRFSDNS